MSILKYFSWLCPHSHHLISWRLKELSRGKENKRKDIIRVPRNWGRRALSSCFLELGRQAETQHTKPQNQEERPQHSLAGRDQAGETFVGVFI